MVFRSKKTGQLRSIPLSKGLKQLEKKLGKGNFLPVMINNDLQMIDGKVPCMHLHRIKIDKLAYLSDFQRNDLQEAIERKMEALVA